MKYCKECKIEYPENESFCEECGSKLVKFVEDKEEPKEEKNVKPTKEKSSNRKLGLIIIIGIVFIIMVVGLKSYSDSTLTTTGQVSKSTNEQTSNKCYDVQESYTVQVPYTYYYDYSVTQHDLIKDYSIQLGEYSVYKVTISNNEGTGGNFQVEAFFVINSVSQPTMSDTKYIYSHSTQTFQFIYDNKLGDSVTASYKITQPTEIRYRDETRYRTVQKCD